MKLAAGLFLLAGCLSLAATLPATVSALPVPEEQQPIVTQQQVNRWLQIWQKRLALADWKVEARIVRQADLNPETLGNLKWSSKDRTASIKVLDPRDYDMPVQQIPADIERTVVHELVHLELSVLPRNGSRKVEEQVVNRVTEALLGLDHGDNYEAREAGGPVQPKIKHPAPSPAGDVAARSK